MTKEENIATLNEHLDHWKRLLSEKICDQSEGEKTIDALQNAIKALAQEPTDAVDRVTIKEYLESFKDTNVVTKENNNEQMEFPDTWEEFEEYYGFYDTEEVYTNNSRLIPSFRVKQWLEHQMTAESRMSYVQEAVNAIMNTCNTDSITDKAMRNAAKFVQNAIDGSYPDFEKLPKWIPCSDRLPEVGQRVIATVESIDGNYVRETICGKYGLLCGNGIAWMPLPDPYKQEVENG